jgi:aryl-alcohol dehydrogenase-like predicted oxidoreductase
LPPYCAERGIGVIVCSPLQAGLPSGRWTARRSAELPSDDRRSGNAEFAGAALERNPALARALGAVAARRGSTVAAVAVARTSAFGGVTAANAGARRPAQVDGWLPAANLELTADDLDAVAAAIDATGRRRPVAPRPCACDHRSALAG